jgi:uncharacterized repeat protein (TIGR03943 family)
LGALVFLALGLVSFFRRSRFDPHNGHEDHDHMSSGSPWTLFVLAIPVLLGFLVPAKPLESSALDLRGLTTNAIAGGGGSQTSIDLEQPSDQRTVLDWIRAFNFATDPSIYIGETADVTGFVYEDKRLSADQFMVSRFAVTCCVADAFAIGVIVESPDAANWPGNAWVHVVGKIQVATFDGQAYPLILAESIKEIPVPSQPYLFP